MFKDISPTELAIGALLWIVGGGLVMHFIVWPAVVYGLADAEQRCEIRLKSYGDETHFCDDSHEIVSVAEVEEQKELEAEEARRAALTPQERCREDISGSLAYDETGLIPVCDKDGNVNYYDPQEELDAYYEEGGVTSEGTCSIKGNVSYDTGERIYHVPGDAYYDDTVINESYGERWFCSEQEAIDAGWRHAYY